MYKNIRTASSFCRVVIAFVLLAGFAIPSNAFGAEIKVLCTSALAGAMKKLEPQFERETGNKLVISYDETAGVVKRIKAGETADVVIVTASALDNMVRLEKSRSKAARPLPSVALGSRFVEVHHGRTSARPRPSSELCLTPSRLLTRTQPMAV